MSDLTVQIATAVFCLLGFAGIYLVLRDREENPKAHGLCPECGEDHRACVGKLGKMRQYRCRVCGNEWDEPPKSQGGR